MTEPKVLYSACSPNPYLYHMQNVSIHNPQCLRNLQHWLWMLDLLKISNSSVGSNWGMIHSEVKFLSSCVSVKIRQVNCFQRRHKTHSLFTREKEESKVKSRESRISRASSFRPWDSRISLYGLMLYPLDPWTIIPGKPSCLHSLGDTIFGGFLTFQHFKGNQARERSNLSPKADYRNNSFELRTS